MGKTSNKPRPSDLTPIYIYGLAPHKPYPNLGFYPPAALAAAAPSSPPPAFSNGGSRADQQEAKGHAMVYLGLSWKAVVGCEVIVCGKLRAQRAESMKFQDGYMTSSGHPFNLYIDSAVSYVLLRQGVLGIKVKIMLDWDAKGKQGPTTPLPKDADELLRPPV